VVLSFTSLLSLSTLVGFLAVHYSLLTVLYWHQILNLTWHFLDMTRDVKSLDCQVKYLTLLEVKSRNVSTSRKYANYYQGLPDCLLSVAFATFFGVCHTFYHFFLAIASFCHIYPNLEGLHTFQGPCLNSKQIVYA
jgi:hypothetical protein